MPSSPDFVYSLTSDALNTLFPMHCILDDEGRIVRAGSTLSKVMRRAVVGEALFDLFEVKRPRSVRSLADLQSFIGRKFILCAVIEPDHCLEFRCVATAMGQGGNTLLIDFAFSAEFLDLFLALQLNASDFKPNDPSLDLIYTIETQRTLVEDSQKLTLALERSRKEAEYAANIDLLTGIANRRYLSSYLRQETVPAISRGSGFLLHLDLNKFKSINDTSGHSAGDAVLQNTARILDEAAGEAGFAARLGGDEFVLLVSGYRSRAAIETLSKRICERISEPIAHDGHVLQVGTSIGIVELCEHGGVAPEQLLSFSDIALYEAKRSREDIVFLNEEMLHKYHERQALIHQIEGGLEQGQFVPFFQPKIDTRTNGISGMEVLVRWQHPQRGLLPPSEFIDEAEAANLMGRIDRCIIAQAVKAYGDWLNAGFIIGKLSINLTTYNLQSATFVEYLADELRKYGLTTRHVELELLESILFDCDDSSLLERCRELSQAGFHLALDDFGTGYASISTLIDNTITTIKIDRSFISGIDKQPRLQRITRSILALSHQLDLHVVAEGVETGAELEVLKAFGCHLVQGYYFSRPLDADRMEGWLRAWGECAQEKSENQRSTR